MEVGIIGSVNYYYDFPNKLWDCGDILNYKTFLIKKFDAGKMGKSSFYSIDAVPVCSSLINRETINTIGLFYKII